VCAVHFTPTGARPLGAGRKDVQSKYCTGKVGTLMKANEKKIDPEAVIAQLKREAIVLDDVTADIAAVRIRHEKELSLLLKKELMSRTKISSLLSMLQIK
jgi:hypothetical protein